MKLVSDRAGYMNNTGYYNDKKIAYRQLLIIIYSVWQVQFLKRPELVLRDRIHRFLFSHFKIEEL